MKTKNNSLLKHLRSELKKGATQAEKGIFSKRSVKDIITSQKNLLKSNK